MKLRISKPKFLSKIHLPRRAERPQAVRSDRGGASAGWLAAMLLAFLFGLALAMLFGVAADGLIASRIFRLQRMSAGAAAAGGASVFSATALPKGEIRFTPFDAAAKKEDEPEEEKKEAKPIDSFILKGTVPPEAAWVTVENETSFVLTGQEFNGYVLSAVSPGSVTFTLDDDSYTIYLNFSAVVQAPPKKPGKAAAAPAPSQGGASNIQNAEFNGQDGTVTRELLNGLLMNPYSELGKLRLVPTDSGMIVQSMRSDSILNQLGVKKGDEITGINGISIKDVPSIMNAINSMMSGARLDFDVRRGNEPGKLGYVVK